VLGNYKEPIISNVFVLTKLKFPVPPMPDEVGTARTSNSWIIHSYAMPALNVSVFSYSSVYEFQMCTFPSSELDNNFVCD